MIVATILRISESHMFGDGGSDADCGGAYTRARSASITSRTKRFPCLHHRNARQRVFRSCIADSWSFHHWTTFFATFAVSGSSSSQPVLRSVGACSPSVSVTIPCIGSPVSGA